MNVSKGICAVFFESLNGLRLYNVNERIQSIRIDDLESDKKIKEIRKKEEASR